MNIIIVGTAYPMRGGIAHFNALLYQSLKSRSHRVSMISFKRQYPSLFFPGKTQLETGHASGLRVESELLLDSIGPLSWIRVGQRIRRLNADVVIFKHWMPFFAPCYFTVSRVAKRGSTTKILYVCDNIIPHERRFGDKALTRLALSAADGFIVMSRSVEKDLLRMKPAARYEFVHHPVYENFAGDFTKAAAREKLGINSGPVILFFGYVRRYKGLHILLEAMKLVREKLDVTLIIAGEFYDSKEPYQKQIEALGLGNSVKLLDRYIPDNEVGLYYAAADVVALPYLSATQSGIVQICYHFNKPVIATDVGGLPEVVRDGMTGFVIPAGDAAAFAGAILRYFEGNHEAAFSRHVAEAKKMFSWDRMAEAIEKCAK